MSDNFVGIMWNKNEGDILEEIITRYLPHLDSLIIADDGSIDNSWDIMQSLKKRYPDKIESIQREPTPEDPAQRNSMLAKVRSRYRPEDTWVMVAESDTMILDTNIREIVKTQSIGDLYVNWLMINAVREQGTWKDIDTFPNWTKSITEIMPTGYAMENGYWIFRPLNDLYYDKVRWRPWPRGFSKHVYGVKSFTDKEEEMPLIAHYGYRGPTHFFTKLQRNNHVGRVFKKYPLYDTSSKESVEKTVYFFNNHYKNVYFPMGREGLKNKNEERRKKGEI